VNRRCAAYDTAATNSGMKCMACGVCVAGFVVRNGVCTQIPRLYGRGGAAAIYKDGMGGQLCVGRLYLLYRS